MPKLLLPAGLLAALVAAAPLLEVHSPWPRTKTKPDASQGAVVAQVIGIDTWVQITYHRPGVKGRELWSGEGERPLVPMDGDPWRAGANEATTLEVTTDVTLAGEALGKGRYALFLVPRSEGAWTLILNAQADQWGSFRRDPEQDVLSVDVQPEAAPHAEWLTFGFDDAQTHSTRAYMHWGEIKVPFTIEVPEES